LEEDGGGDSEYPVDYPLYKSFWSLQNLLSSPSAVAQSRQTATDFILTTEKVLDAFEGCKRGEEDREWGRKRWLEEKKEGEVTSSDDKEEVRRSVRSHSDDYNIHLFANQLHSSLRSTPGGLQPGLPGLCVPPSPPTS
jgi:hypothetical protein